jgi:hypothetical protein
MTSAKSSNPGPRASPRIVCYGTAFLADAPIDTAALKRGIASDVPQFSSPRLDVSFLINCGRSYAGGWATMDSAPSAYVKRIAGSDFCSPKGTVIYQCSTELQDLLAALTPKCAAEMATDWYSMYGRPKTKPAEPNGRTQIRFVLIKNLAALAIKGKDRQTKLMLRVEYRKQRQYSSSG